MANLATRPLGNSGLNTSVVGLGCNNFGRRLDLEGTRAVVDAALDDGVTFFDTADIYGRGASEEYLGEVLQGRRDQVVLATKFGMDMGDGKGPRGARDYIQQAIDASLCRLRTDVVDFYWYHRPDGVTPIAETLEALHELIRPARSARSAPPTSTPPSCARPTPKPTRTGSRRSPRSRTSTACWCATPSRTCCRPASGCTSGSSPSSRSPPGCSPASTGPASPARPGARLSERDEIATEAQFALVAALQGYADERGVSLLDVAIGALLAQPVISSVIAGRHQARAGPRQRRRRQVDPRRGRHRRAGLDPRFPPGLVNP